MAKSIIARIKLASYVEHTSKHYRCYMCAMNFVAQKCKTRNVFGINVDHFTVGKHRPVMVSKKLTLCPDCTAVHIFTKGKDIPRVVDRKSFALARLVG